MDRPFDLFDRSREWDDLRDFLAGDAPVRIGIVYGRRRQGKSWLLRRLARAAGGIYTMALEQDRLSALARMGAALAEASGLPDTRIALADWEKALHTARSILAHRGERLLVLDEYPYLLDHSPELSSVLQAFHDDVRDEGGGAPLRIILCGSAISVMEELLAGTSPLRGRTQLEMKVRPFDFRTAASFWQVEDPDIAFHLHAVLGGTAGYRDLVQEPPPPGLGGFPGWLSRTVLNPSSALFTEAEYLLREDPRIRDRAVYHAILAAVSQGRSTPTEIGGAVGRDRTALSHPLEVLTTSGFLDLSQDLRKQRGSALRIADPIVRFHQLVTRPRLSQFEERRFDAAWKASIPTFRSQLLGPHFEELAREWVLRFAGEDTLGGAVGEVGFSVIPDRRRGRSREVDVLALAAGERRGSRSSRVLCIGEAKSSDRRRTLADLERLEEIRALLLEDGADCEGARLLLFGRSGFEADLVARARRSTEVVLVDLHRLYGGS